MMEQSRSDLVTLAEFTVPSTLGEERVVMERVTAALAGLGVPEERLRRLETAAAEAAMNAIEHGNRLAPDLPVDVSVQASPESIVVRVTDHGRGSPASASQPDLEAKLAGEQSPRGWGMFLMKEMVDDVRLRELGDRHAVELILHRDRPTVVPGAALTTKAHPQDGVTVLELAGDINRDAAATMDSAYRSTGTEGPVVLDFTRVGYIDSSGIALLIGFIARATADRRRVAAFGLTPHYAQIFSVTRLSDYVTVQQDRAAAVASAAIS